MRLQFQQASTYVSVSFVRWLLKIYVYVHLERVLSTSSATFGRRLSLAGFSVSLGASAEKLSHPKPP